MYAYKANTVYKPKHTINPKDPRPRAKLSPRAAVPVTEQPYTLLLKHKPTPKQETQYLLSSYIPSTICKTESLHTNMLQKRSHILSFNAKSRWHTNLPSTRIHQPRSQNRRHQTIVSGIIQLHGTQAFSGWIPPLIMSPSLQIHTSCRITSFHSKGQSVCMHRSPLLAL